MYFIFLSYISDLILDQCNQMDHYFHSKNSNFFSPFPHFLGTITLLKSLRLPIGVLKRSVVLKKCSLTIFDSGVVDIPKLKS